MISRFSLIGWCLLSVCVACGAQDEQGIGEGEALATLPEHAVSMAIADHRAIAAGYFYLKEIDLVTGATTDLPALDNARWLEWSAVDRAAFVDEEFMHFSGNKAYFPTPGVTNTPTVYELDVSTGAVRDFVVSEPAEYARPRLLRALSGSAGTLYAETLSPNPALWEIDPASGAWKQLASWGSNATSGGPIFADSEAIYAGGQLQISNTEAGMIRWDRATRTSATVASFDAISRITADEAYVYVSGARQGDWGIYRVPNRGGSPERLLARAPADAIVTGLVVDDEFLYFSEQLRVLRLAKRGGEAVVLAEHTLPGLYRSLRLHSGQLFWLDDNGEQTIVRRVMAK